MRDIKKVETLLNNIKCDLFYLQEKLNLETHIFTPASEAFNKIETDVNNAIAIIKDFTPKKDQPKKVDRLIFELINLDKKELLLNQYKNMI